VHWSSVGSDHELDQEIMAYAAKHDYVVLTNALDLARFSLSPMVRSQAARRADLRISSTVDRRELHCEHGQKRVSDGRQIAVGGRVKYRDRLLTDRIDH
jgi:hypothetical protein